MQTYKVTRKEYDAVQALSEHVTAIENLRPALLEVLSKGHRHPLFDHVGAEVHNMSYEVAQLTKYWRG